MIKVSWHVNNTCRVSPTATVIQDRVPEDHSQGQVLNLLEVEEGGGEEGGEQGVGEEQDLVQGGVLLVPDPQQLTPEAAETVTKRGENYPPPWDNQQSIKRLENVTYLKFKVVTMHTD